MSQETLGMECCMPAGVYLLADPEWVAQGHGCSSVLQALCKPLVPQANVSDGPSFGFLSPHGLCCSKTPDGVSFVTLLELIISGVFTSN